MNHIYVDASLGPVSACIGFYFESDQDQGMTYTKCVQVNLDKSFSSVEAEFRSILLAVDFVSTAVNKHPNLKSQFFTIYTDCKSSNEMIHGQRFISDNHKPFIDQFRESVKGLNISVQWTSRKNNKAHSVVYKESRKCYDQYMRSIDVKGRDQSVNVSDIKSIVHVSFSYI